MARATAETFGDLLAEARARLRSSSDSARTDAELLLAHAADRARMNLHAWRDDAVDAQTAARFRQLVARRENSEPVAYLIGYKAFWTLDLIVTPDVLIPRPETELLVEWTLSIIDSSFPRTRAEPAPPAPTASRAPCRRRESSLRILDLGTGSGAIALSLAKELVSASLTATDDSRSALHLASENARRAGLLDVQFLLGSWFQALDSGFRRNDERARFNLIVSNPPYIRAGDPHLPDLRFEPQQALIAGKDGLEALRIIIGEAPEWLKPGGWLLVEHGYDQAVAVRVFFANAGFAEIETRRDLAGHERATGGRRRS